MTCAWYKLELERADHAVELEGSQHGWRLQSGRVLNYGLLALTILILVIVAGSIFTLAWHMLAPGDNFGGSSDGGWHWLRTSELGAVKDFILSGALVSLGLQYFRRFVEDR